MRKLTLSFMTASALFISAIGVNAAENSKVDAKSLLKEQQQLERALERERAPVKTLQDFYRLQGTSEKGVLAFNKLPSHAKSEFISSLTFTENGLGSYNYRIVEDHLTVTEAHDLLSLFGVQYTVRSLKGLKVKTNADLLLRQKSVGTLACCDEGDRPDYACIGVGTCQSRGGHICTDRC